MTRAHICAQESEGRAKSESAKERMNYNIPHSRACTHPHARAFLRERTGRIAATTCACTQDGEASPRARGLAIAANRALRRACPRNPPRLEKLRRRARLALVRRHACRRPRLRRRQRTRRYRSRQVKRAHRGTPVPAATTCARRHTARTHEPTQLMTSSMMTTTPRVLARTSKSPLAR